MNDVEIGEEFLHEGYYYLKISEDKAALIWYEYRQDWKKEIKLDS